MPASVVGRDAELAALRNFVAGISNGASALVLEGEAGMGKTTLWRAGLQQAAIDGLRTLEAQPAESESELSFAGLGDLLDVVLDEALEPLPTGQRSALSRALVLEDVEGSPPDAHAVGVALLGALRALAASGRVLVAVDDVQWLDSASAAALAYAGRRLRGEPIGILLARRAGLTSPLADELSRTLGDRTVHLDVGPLDAAALHRVVNERLGASLPRPLLAEVHQASGGNPFYAIEIVRTLQRRGAEVEAGRPLPVPESLHDLVDERLTALPDESRYFLLAAAAHAHPTVAITEAASDVGADAGLAPAVAAGIVEVDGSRIRFTHPLLAAGVLEAADPGRRAAVHRRLAELLEDPEARAWQLAACCSEPDETVAAALEAASTHARARGAPRPAALLLDRAQHLTPSDLPSERIRRAVDAAFLHFEAGDSRRAEAQLRAVVAPLSAGPERARALAVLARIRLYEEPQEARELFLQVVEEAGDDGPTSAIAHEGIAACSVWTFERFEEGLRHSERALALIPRAGGDALMGDVLMTRLSAETLLGYPSAETTEARCLELQEATLEARVLDQPLISVAERWIWVDRHAEARDALEALLQHASEIGDENCRPWASCLLGEVELVSGEFDRALALALEAQQAAEQSGQPIFVGLGFALESMVRAQRGEAEPARASAQRALGSSPNGYARLESAAALGHLALASGVPEEAVRALGPCIAFVREERMVEPGVMRFAIDYVEALTELGRTEDAGDLLAWYERNARRLERASALANCARCRGLRAAQAGDLDAALAAFAEALEWHAQVELPLDRGRTLLALGAAQRRLKRRREARETLEQALAVFERIGASIWAERTRGELRRISGRAATPGALTPAEERVATLVAEGKTNKEVAAALFLSDRTIEGHLARIFGKLGIRHRAELAGALQTRGIGVSNPGDSPVSAEAPAP